MNVKQKTEQRLIDKLGGSRRQVAQLALSETAHDLVERNLRKRRETLPDSEEKYRYLFDNMLNGLAYCKIIVDENNEPVDFVYLEVNDSFERLTGLKKESVIDKRVTEAIPGTREAHPELFNIFGRVASTGDPTSFELYFKPLAIWLTIRAYSHKRGYFTTVFENITRRKEAEELFKTLSEYSPTSIYIVQDKKFQYVNKQFTQLLGYQQDELLGTNSMNYVFPGDRDIVMASAALMLKAKLPYPYEYRVINKTGEMRWVMESVSSMQYKGRRATLGNSMDITERKILERKIFEYEELSKLKTNLLSTVSHELRTPLATIKGYSTMLLDYEQRLQKDEKRQYLQSINRATDRLTELVDHLLDMSLLEAGLLKLQKAPANITNLLKEAVAQARFRYPAHQIKLNLINKLPEVNLDTKRVWQVLDNLIDNACKYSKEGTKIVVSAQLIWQEIWINVADQGIGIPEEELHMIFDRMYRVEQRLTPEIDGAGLGLAICKGLVEAHGGRIWMESETGKGSRCCFTLPLHAKQLPVRHNCSQ